MPLKPRFRCALEHINHRAGKADRAELRRIWQPDAGDTYVDGLISQGFVESDREQRLTITVAGLRAIADPEWMPDYGP